MKSTTYLSSLWMRHFRIFLHLRHFCCLQEKETIEEEEEDDTFDMDIKVTDPEKIGVFAFTCFGILILFIYNIYI